MRAFTVHAPPDDAQATDRFAFVKDGISWPALIVPILWILWHRLWLTLVWYIAYILAVAWIGRLFGDNVAIIVAILGAILFALEANNIRRLSLEGRGWRDLGGSFGDNLDEAEIRFFGTWKAPSEPVAPEGREPTGWTGSRSGVRDEDTAVLGLFPEPEFQAGR